MSCNPWQGKCHPKLDEGSSKCFVKLDGIYEFGSNSPDPGIIEFPLYSNGKILEGEFQTRTKSKINSRKYLRRLCVVKIDKNKDFFIERTDDSASVASLGNRRNVRYKIQLLEERPTGKYDTLTKIPFSVVNSENTMSNIVLEKIPFRQLDDDGINLPTNLNSRFYIRLYAIGNVNRKRSVKLNCIFYIDYAGEIESKSERIQPTDTLPIGTNNVLFGGP